MVFLQRLRFAKRLKDRIKLYKLFGKGYLLKNGRRFFVVCRNTAPIPS